MKQRFGRVAVIALAMATLVVALATAAGNGEPSAPPAKDPVVLRSIYPGDEPPAMTEVLAAVNRKMGADIGVNLKLVWAPWDQYSNKLELAIAAGEQVDYIWLGSSDMARLTAKKLIVPIDDLLAKHGEVLYKTVDRKLFNTMKIDGKVMGFPSTGNTPKRDVFQVILYREDLRTKHKLPALDSIAAMEKFFDTVRANEPGMVPLSCKAASYRIMKAFGNGWFLGGTNGAAGFDITGPKSIKVMAIQDLPNYKAATLKVREWYLKGYQPADILNVSDETSLLLAGSAAATAGSAMTASENQGTISQTVPGAVLAETMLEAPGATKYLGGEANGGNATYVTSVTKHPDAVVEFWGWILTSQENYDLYCYGIRGKQYDLDNGKIKYLNTDYTTFPNWMFKNLAFLRFPAGMTEAYIQTIKDWDKGAVQSPLTGFVFNPKNVSAELAAYAAVWGQYSNALGAGTLDLDANVPEIVAKFRAAGQEKIVAEAQRQIDAFLAGK